MLDEWFLVSVDEGKRALTLIIWDGLPRNAVDSCANTWRCSTGRIVLVRLPGNAPELKPVGYVFSYTEQREFANLRSETIAEVRRYATRTRSPRGSCTTYDSRSTGRRG